MSPASDCLRICFATSSTPARVGAMLQRAFAGPLDDRAIGHRIAEGHAQLDDIGAGVDRRQRDLARGVQVGIAAGDVGHQPGPFL